MSDNLEKLESLEDILYNEEYLEINTPEYKQKTIDYIRNFDIEEISGEEQIDFLKKLTKISSIILKENPESLEGLLERIYSYHLMGAKTIEKENLKTVSGNNAEVVKSHFYSHASDFANVLFEKTGDEKWAKQTYENAITSAETCPTYNDDYLKHIATCYKISADFARYVFYKKKNKDGIIDFNWAEKWYNSRIQSINAFKKIEPETTINEMISVVGETRYLFLHENGGNRWGERLYNNAISTAKMGLNYNYNEFALKYFNFAAMAAEELAKETKTIEWDEKKYSALMKKAKIIHKINNFPENAKKLVDTYKNLSITAKKVFEEKKEKEWCYKWYAADEIGARFAETYDFDCCAILNSHSGQAAKVLFDITKEINWLEKAFNSKKKAGEIHEEKNRLENAAFDYGNAGYYAGMIYNENRDIEWAKKWYTNDLKAAVLKEKTDGNYKTRYYEDAGLAAKEIFSKTKELEWGENWYTANSNAAKSLEATQEKTDKKIMALAYKYGFAAMAAKEVFYETQEIEWAKKWYTEQNNSLKISELVEKDINEFKKSAIFYTASAAKELFLATKEVEWGEGWYSLEIRLAEESFKESEIDSYRILSYAGDCAIMMYETTNEKNWLEKAINHYGLCKEYFKNNGNNDKYSTVALKLKFLESEQNTHY